MPTDDGPSIPGHMLDRLEEIFQEHAGPDNAITSSEVADLVFINDGDANPKTRDAIRTLVEEREIPVAAGSRGYYRIQSPDELSDYLETLDARINGIEKRKSIVTSAWNREKQQIADEREQRRQAMQEQGNELAGESSG